MTRLVLADDHEVVRQGIKLLIEGRSDLALVGEATNGPQAVDMVTQLKPDVAIVDLALPGLNGLEVMRQLARRHPRTRVVVLSMYSDEGYVSEALEEGASAYVLKGVSSTEILKAIDEVMRGRKYLSPPLSLDAVEALRKGVRQSQGDAARALTTREREVLRLAAEGKSSTETAKQLGISPRTAETHRANVMRKLGVHRRADLVRFALERGLVSDGPVHPPPPPHLPARIRRDD